MAQEARIRRHKKGPSLEISSLSSTSPFALSFTHRTVCITGYPSDMQETPAQTLNPANPKTGFDSCWTNGKWTDDILQSPPTCQTRAPVRNSLFWVNLRMRITPHLLFGLLSDSFCGPYSLALSVLLASHTCFSLRSRFNL